MGANELSPAAQKLIELMGGEDAFDVYGGNKKTDLAKVLTEHPELMAGLNEYVAWRDKAMGEIAESHAASSVRHGAVDVLKGIRRQPKPKKKRCR
jgi:hypothetical protein